MLVWPSTLHPVAYAALALAAAGGGILLWRRLRERFSAPQAAALLAPKLVAFACLLLALAEPVWRKETTPDSGARVLVAVDASASMAVADGAETRFARALALEGALRAALPPGCRVETRSFDTALHPGVPAEPTPNSGTDLAGCLRALAGENDPPAAVVLLTDGGDESVDGAALPGAPLFIAGFGAASAKPDLGIEEARAPAEAEAEVNFDLTVDLRALGSAPGLAAVPVILAEETADGRRKLAEKTADLSRGRARVVFPVKAAAQGVMRLLVMTPVLPGERSPLNNSRPVTVTIRRRALHVLFFTRELGLDFKLLRQELGRDPGLTLTALYRTLGERFTLQGERLPGDEDLEAGFPDNPRTLALYSCIILGAFPAADWPPAGLAALAAYVESGGSVLFLGGEQAFGAGGYADTPAAPLLPWEARADEPPLQSGRFPVSIPREAAAHPVVAGLESRLARERDVSVESLNRPGPARPAAETLLTADAAGTPVPLLTVQTFGKGRTGGLASNTLWKWARRSQPLGEAYGLLLRQWVRWAAGESDGGRYLAVRWDRDRYRPGEEASAAVTLAGKETEGATLTAAVAGPDGSTLALPVEPQAGVRDAYRVRVPFQGRGTYTVTLSAARNGVVLESVAKSWPVSPLVPEGARLGPDEAWLERLAVRGGGAYAPEENAKALIARIRQAAAGRTITVELPVAQSGPWLALLFFCALAVEWVLRRRLNLI
jgi:uncharacterized membrane protein